MSRFGRIFSGPERRGNVDWDLWGQGEVSATSSYSAVEALRLSSVWRCVMLIAGTISTMPVHAIKRGDDVRLPVEPAPPILARPSDAISPTDWRHSVVSAWLLHGNAVGVVTSRDRAGRPTTVELVDQTSGRIDARAEFGRAPVVLIDGKVEPDGWLAPGIVLPGQSIGVTPIAYAARVLALAGDASKMSRDWWSRGGHPTALLSTDQKLQADQASEIKARFRAATTRDHLAVLGSGVKFQTLQTAPSDAGLLETLAATDVDIARFFGVPASMIDANAGQGGSLTYSNRTDADLNFLAYGLQPWITRLESMLEPMLPVGQVAKVRTASLLRTSPETTAKITDMRVRGGTMTPNEARRLHDEPPSDSQYADQVNWPPGTTARPNDDEDEE